MITLKKKVHTTAPAVKPPEAVSTALEPDPLPEIGAEGSEAVTGLETVKDMAKTPVSEAQMRRNLRRAGNPFSIARGVHRRFLFRYK